MNIAIDWDGTFERFPEIYKTILSSWTHGKKYILTARPVTEHSITLSHMWEAGVEITDVDELLMFPKAYLFDFEAPEKLYWRDSGEILFRNEEHRRQHLSYVKSRYNTVSEGIHNTEQFTDYLAKWKVQVCKERNIQAVFEDSEKNARFMREAGIYTFLVDRSFERKI